jgi:hypothetical protein
VGNLNMGESIINNFMAPGQDQHLVAIACVSAVPGSCTFFTAQLLCLLVEEQFRRDGVKSVSAPLFDSTWVVVLSSVPELNPALRCLFRASELFGAQVQYPLIEIGRFDCDEGYWRTVLPLPSHAPFSRFLTPELFQASKEQAQLYARFLGLLRQYAQAKYDSDVG